MKHYVNLPAIGRSIPIRDYVRGIKLAKAHPKTRFRHGLTCWYPVDGAEIMRQFRASIHERINRHLAETEPRDDVRDLRADLCKVEDFLYRKRRSTGSRNLLATRLMKKRYPEVNNQPA